MKRVARAHRVALMGLVLLGVILVPRVGMGLHTVTADANTGSNASTGSGSSDTPTATPTPAMEIPSVTATPTAMTAPAQATMMPTAVVSASATTVAPPAAATSTPGADATNAATETPTPAMEIPSVTATPTETTASQQPTLAPTAAVSATPQTVAPSKTPSPAEDPSETPQPDGTETPTPTSTPTPTKTTVSSHQTTCEDGESCDETEKNLDCTNVPAPDTANLQDALLKSALTKRDFPDDTGGILNCEGRVLDLKEIFNEDQDAFVKTLKSGVSNEERTGGKLYIAAHEKKDNNNGLIGSTDFRFTFTCQENRLWVLNEISAVLKQSNSGDSSPSNAEIRVVISTENPNKPEHTSCPKFNKTVISRIIKNKDADPQDVWVSEETLTETLGSGLITILFGDIFRELSVSDVTKKYLVSTGDRSAQTKLNTSERCDGAIFSALFGLNEQLLQFWPNLSTLELGKNKWPMVESLNFSETTKIAIRHEDLEFKDKISMEQRLDRTTRAIGTPENTPKMRDCAWRHSITSQNYDVQGPRPLRRNRTHKNLSNEKVTSIFRAEDLSVVEGIRRALLLIQMWPEANGQWSRIKKRLDASLLPTLQGGPNSVFDSLVTELNVDDQFFDNGGADLPLREKKMLDAYLKVRTEFRQDGFFPPTPSNPFNDSWFNHEYWAWDWGAPFPPDVPAR